MAAGTKDEQTRRKDRDFFRIAPLPICSLIACLMIFYWFVCFKKELVPFHLLGPLGQFVLYLANNHMRLLRVGFRFAVVVHVLEGGFAYRVSRRMMFSRLTSFKWLLQTTLFGFPSLGLLLRHRKEREDGKQKNS